MDKNIRKLILLKVEELFQSQNLVIHEGISFPQFLEYWKQYHLSNLRLTTQFRYKQIIQQSLIFFESYRIHEITSKHIDDWLEHLKAIQSPRKRRVSFIYELKILRSLLSFYEEVYEPDLYRSPIRKRHYIQAKVTHPRPRASKEMTLEQFQHFHNTLTHHNGLLAAMCGVQYFQALRISEVAALCWEDVFLNEENISLSFIRIQRSIKWLTGHDSQIESGFKNSKALGGFKELPLFPSSYDIFIDLRNDLAKRKLPITGLIFLDSNGKPFRYRKIQYAYDKAFKKANLPFSGTHIMRHGGSRRLHKRNPNLETVKLLLGNTNDDSAKIYIGPSDALTRAVAKEWKERKNKKTA